MPRIKILPPDLRNKIAAGEVIERPASVLKELLENSLDADATEIRADVFHGGKRSIKVSDNGIGMDREDALLCFERHATSKLLCEGDLFEIRTLGFRGEALPSIASVSKVRLDAALRGARSGVSLEIEGGEIKSVKESAPSGTTIEVRELFFNTPARQKFLKKNSTELYHIIETITREAMVHYAVGFELWTEGKEAMLLPRASGLRERMMQIYGGEFLEGLIEATAERSGIGLKAFVSNAMNFRSTRSHQCLFINGRPIKDSALSSGVYNAYEGILPPDKHPLFFLFLDIEPKAVDFNVHPTKKEVRFLDRESVRTFVIGCIREAVRAERRRFVGPFVDTSLPAVSQIYNPAGGSSSESYAIPLSENLDIPYRPALPFLYLGDTFIASSGKGGLMVVDHHAAHERILFEKILKGIALNISQLLFPERVRLSPAEYSSILEGGALLSEFGFEIEDFGHDTVIIRAVPEPLIGADLRGILSDAAVALRKGGEPGRPLKEALAAKIACHSSVRGREILNSEEFSRLISDLEKTDCPDQCPHGRPTRLYYSLDDLTKMFGRK